MKSGMITRMSSLKRPGDFPSVLDSMIFIKSSPEINTKLLKSFFFSSFPT